MSSQIHRFTIGAFECAIIEFMTIAYDATQQLPVPRDELETAFGQYGIDPTAAPFSINILYVKTPEHQVLIDSSTGRVEGLPGTHDLVDDLLAAGIQPQEIDCVVITHGHMDHIGGLTDAAGNVFFSNARHFMLKGEWEYWTAPEQVTPKDENDVMALAARKTLLPLSDRIVLIDGEESIVPGISAIHASGHTLHQMAAQITSNGETLLHAADALHFPLQIVRPEWSLNVDLQPEISVQTRQSILHRAAQENTLLMAYHFPFPGLVRVVEQNGGWVWEDSANTHSSGRP